MGSYFFHTVASGERSHSIERKYGVSWKVILELAPNAFLRDRERRRLYPIRPGDRVAIPASSAAGQVQIAQSHSTWLSRALDSLVALHPSYPTGVKYYGAPPGPPALHNLTSSQTLNPASSSTDPAGYKKKLTRAWKSVVLTSSIESGFENLLPYLPMSAVMTSGFRSDADQVRIINEYYAQKEGDPAVTDVEQRRQWLKKKKGLVIAKVGTSPHKTGLAFDLSGADLDVMNNAVSRCMGDLGLAFPVHSTIVERNQNCLHINMSG